MSEPLHVRKRLSSPLLKCIPQTGYGCVRAPSATSIRSTRIGLEFLMYHAGIQGLLRPVFGVLLHVDSFLHYSFVASHGSEGTRRLSTCIDLWGRFLSCCETQSFCEARRILRVSQHEPLLLFMAQDIKRGGPDQPNNADADEPPSSIFYLRLLEYADRRLTIPTIGF